MTDKYEGYDGEFKDGKRHGKGKQIDDEGDVYEGEFFNDQYNGKGRMDYVDGDIYQGNWKDGIPHGKGVMIYTNGDKYEGDFEDGDIHGSGTMIYTNGNKYVGEWDGGVRHGQGKTTFAESKGFYEGNYRNNKRDGKGILKLEGDPVKEGYFEEGEYIGKEPKPLNETDEDTKIDSPTEGNINPDNKPKLTYKEILDKLLLDLDINEEKDKKFFEFLNKAFDDKKESPEGDYNLVDINKKLTFNKSLIQNLESEISNLDSNLSAPFKEMVKNLVMVQIYSYIDKNVIGKKSIEDMEGKNKKMFSDIIGLVNKSLQQTNSIFEKKFNNQVGGEDKESLSEKINSMKNYFRYKLKYMILKRKIIN